MSAPEMSDDEFVHAFESCALSPDAFRHRDHIRLARIYLDRCGSDADGLEAATARFIGSLKQFAGHLGISEKYHETITVAWVRLVAFTPPGDFPKLLDKNYIQTFYSPELLSSHAARIQFVAPDRAPLPARGTVRSPIES